MRRAFLAAASLSLLAAAPPPPSVSGKPAPAAIASAPTKSYGPRLEGFDYPFPVKEYRFTEQGQQVEMAYMELMPQRPNGRAIVLLHGKNFCAATWGDTARVLAAAGYRVIVPDQIGFCKSSKPSGFQYSLYGLAQMTADLIRSRGLSKVTVVGHSMGGMLAMRLAIASPQLVDQLVLVNPLGLADRLAQGVPYADIDRQMAMEEKRDAASIKAYEQKTYYHGTWRPAYQRWVDMSAGLYAGPGRKAVQEAQARLSEMIETQPVSYELNRIQAPTTLMIGTLDTTAFGKNWAPPEVANQIPAIPTIADKAAQRMPHGRMVPLPGLGHAPQVEDPARFQVALLQILSGM